MVFQNVEVEQSFEDLCNSRSYYNRVKVGRIRFVILLRNKLNKCMLPSGWASLEFKDKMIKPPESWSQLFRNLSEKS